jgi:ABC-2 type transport system permease protein
MLGLLRTEIAKQWRRPRTWVALGFVMVVPIIITIALKLNPPDFSGEGDGERFFYLATQTGLIVPVAALRLMSRFFLVVVVCMFAGDAIASEAGWGNLRYLLVRPVGRGRLLTVKLVVAAMFAALATALVALSGLVVGVIAFGWHPLEIPFLGLSQSPGGDASAGAIFAAVGLYIITVILDQITSLGSIRYGLPLHYFDAWSDLFSRNQFTDDMWRSIFLQVPYVILFCGIAWWWFRRKDVKS